MNFDDKTEAVQVNAKDCGVTIVPTLMQAFLFELPLEVLEFWLLYWSELSKWLVW